MKKFLLQTTAFIVVVLAAFACLIAQTDGYADAFYGRFSSPKQSSLILGTSRAAQGLLPQVFDEILGCKMYNYAFTVNHSPYGKIYYNSIKNKLASTGKNNIFIVTVDPWAISSNKSNPNDSANFRENKLPLANTTVVDMNPNFFYLVNNNNFGKYTKILFSKKDTTTYLHDNGWLEVSVDTKDSIKAKLRLSNKVKSYRATMLPKYEFSSLRFFYLMETIKYLNQYGKVYLVRLPAHPEIIKIEEELMPDFNQKIQAAIELSAGYLDICPEADKFVYTDGNHLEKTSAKIVSEKIAYWIKSL